MEEKLAIASYNNNNTNELLNQISEIWNACRHIKKAWFSRKNEFFILIFYSYIIIYFVYYSYYCFFFFATWPEILFRFLSFMSVISRNARLGYPALKTSKQNATNYQNSKNSNCQLKTTQPLMTTKSMVESAWAEGMG